MKRSLRRPLLALSLTVAVLGMAALASSSPTPSASGAAVMSVHEASVLPMAPRPAPVHQVAPPAETMVRLPTIVVTASVHDVEG